VTALPFLRAVIGRMPRARILPRAQDSVTKNDGGGFNGSAGGLVGSAGRFISSAGAMSMNPPGEITNPAGEVINPAGEVINKPLFDVSPAGGSVKL